MHETFAMQLARAFTPEDYQAVFADPGQMSLFAPSMITIPCGQNARPRSGSAKMDSLNEQLEELGASAGMCSWAGKS